MELHAEAADRAKDVAIIFARVLNNGGYAQFFANSSNEYVPIVVEALERIGCQLAARLTKRAIDAIGVDPGAGHSYPGAIAILAPDRVDELAQCDAEYFDVVGDLANPLFEFVKRERTRIVLN